jgi:hypothetical protein
MCTTSLVIGRAQGKERTSFLKKRSKKLLLLRRPNGTEPNGQKFFGSFFQKRTLP